MPPRARQRLLHTCQSGGRQCAPGLCPVRTAHRRHGPRVQGRSPGGFPTAFDIKSGAPAESEAPGALPIKIQRSHLQKSGAPRRHPGRRMARRGRRAPRVGGYAGKRATTGRPYIVGTSYGSLTSPQAAKLVPSTVPPLPPEPASLGFGGGPVFAYVTGAAAPRVARIGITLQALGVAALYQVRPPGRRRCHAAEILWRVRRRTARLGPAHP